MDLSATNSSRTMQLHNRPLHWPPHFVPSPSPHHHHHLQRSPDAAAVAVTNHLQQSPLGFPPTPHSPERRSFDWKRLVHSYPSLFNTSSPYFNRANHAAVYNTIRRRLNPVTFSPPNVTGMDLSVKSAPSGEHLSRYHMEQITNCQQQNCPIQLTSPNERLRSGARPFLNSDRPPLPPLILPPNFPSSKASTTTNASPEIEHVTPDENENMITRHRVQSPGTLSSYISGADSSPSDEKDSTNGVNLVLIDDDDDAEILTNYSLQFQKIAGVQLAALYFDSGEPYFCVTQIIEKLLPEVENSVAKLDHISKQFQWVLPRLATSEQLELLKRYAIISESEAYCGLIQRSLAEYLVQWCYMHKKLDSEEDTETEMGNSNSDSIDDKFYVYHECFGSNEGEFLVNDENVDSKDIDLKTSTCIRCLTCNRLLTCQQFVCHSHNVPVNEHHWGFNSNRWQIYIQIRDSQNNYISKLDLWNSLIEDITNDVEADSESGGDNLDRIVDLSKYASNVAKADENVTEVQTDEQSESDASNNTNSGSSNETSEDKDPSSLVCKMSSSSSPALLKSETIESELLRVGSTGEISAEESDVDVCESESSKEDLRRRVKEEHEESQEELRFEELKLKSRQNKFCDDDIKERTSLYELNSTEEPLKVAVNHLDCASGRNLELVSPAMSSGEACVFSTSQAHLLSPSHYPSQWTPGHSGEVGRRMAMGIEEVVNYPPRAKSQLNPESTSARTDPTLEVILPPRCLSAGVSECIYQSDLSPNGEHENLVLWNSVNPLRVEIDLPEASMSHQHHRMANAHLADLESPLSSAFGAHYELRSAKRRNRSHSASLSTDGSPSTPSAPTGLSDVYSFERWKDIPGTELTANEEKSDLATDASARTGSTSEALQQHPVPLSDELEPLDLSIKDMPSQNDSETHIDRMESIFRDAATDSSNDGVNLKRSRSPLASPDLPLKKRKHKSTTQHEERSASSSPQLSLQKLAERNASLSVSPANVVTSSTTKNHLIAKQSLSPRALELPKDNQLHQMNASRGMFNLIPNGHSQSEQQRIQKQLILQPHHPNGLHSRFLNRPGRETSSGLPPEHALDYSTSLLLSELTKLPLPAHQLHYINRLVLSIKSQVASMQSQHRIALNQKSEAIKGLLGELEAARAISRHAAPLDPGPRLNIPGATPPGHHLGALSALGTGPASLTPSRARIPPPHFGIPHHPSSTYHREPFLRGNIPPSHPNPMIQAAYNHHQLQQSHNPTATNGPLLSHFSGANFPGPLNPHPAHPSATRMPQLPPSMHVPPNPATQAAATHHHHQHLMQPRTSAQQNQLMHSVSSSSGNNSTNNNNSSISSNLSSGIFHHHHHQPHSSITPAGTSISPASGITSLGAASGAAAAVLQHLGQQQQQNRHHLPPHHPTSLSSSNNNSSRFQEYERLLAAAHCSPPDSSTKLKLPFSSMRNVSASDIMLT
ncbi:uncharacterized protein LOC142351474 isoform X2 [Convolutriloba macropyga]|uniref:uncharacterized protein LOC142351474 isoform X2 n=1 Tax=Convolutriloba macropyga TaxID=536237 RepID=UPI003F51D991